MDDKSTQKIVLKPVKAIRPYPNNPRKISEEAVKAVAASIRAFGFLTPITINPKGFILAGHTRHKAAQLLGLERVPCVVVDQLEENQEKAYRIADNKTAELSKWDFSKLEEEVQSIDFDALNAAIDNLDFSELSSAEIQFDEIDFESLGFKPHELDALDTDADVSELLATFDETSPVREREREREEVQRAKEEGRRIDVDRVIFTAEGRREDFGEDFWELAAQLYARGIKTKITDGAG